jgi:hypothetical protein
MTAAQGLGLSGVAARLLYDVEGIKGEQQV